MQLPDPVSMYCLLNDVSVALILTFQGEVAVVYSNRNLNVRSKPA
jgi:hypothetical protein